MDTLFDLSDFEETRPASVFPPEMLACGIHRRHSSADQEAHAADCWHGVCPCCGEPVIGSYDVEINHAGADRGRCVSLELRLNHLTYDIRNGIEPSRHDLGVLTTGWRIGPDGTQIPPDWVYDPQWDRLWATADGFAKWISNEAAKVRTA